MSPLFLLAASALSQTVPTEAADLGPGVHIHVEREVNASADAAWALLAHDFADIESWSSKVVASRAMTTEDVPARFSVDPDAPLPGRVVTAGKFGELTETLVMYDEAGKTFRFAGDGLPKILPYAGNTQAVVDLGQGRSRVTWDIYVVPKGMAKLMKGKIAKRMESGLSQTLDEAVAAIEASEPVVSR